VRADEMPSIALERRLAGTDVLPLKGTAAAPLPEHVRVAVLAALGEHGATPPSRGLAVLRDAIARSLPAPADPEREILVTNGAMHALGLTFRAILEPGDEVIVPVPCYFFGGLIERAGGVFVGVPSWDPEAIERAVTPRSRAFVLTNPNNPDGHLPSRAEVDELLALAFRHNLTVITVRSWREAKARSSSISAREGSRPSGLFGFVTTRARERGVTARSIASGSQLGTGTKTPPARSIRPLKK